MKNVVNWGVIGSGGIAKRRTIPEGIMKARTCKTGFSFRYESGS